MIKNKLLFTDEAIQIMSNSIKHKKFVLILITILMLFSTALKSMPKQEVYIENIDNIGIRIPLEEAVKADAYWTPERRRQAQPHYDLETFPPISQNQN